MVKRVDVEAGLSGLTYYLHHLNGSVMFVIFVKSLCLYVPQKNREW